jgi:RNA-directed DNA polymerase
VTFEAVEGAGETGFLEQLREELVSGTYKPGLARRVEIPKAGGKMRTLSIPTIRDRVVQGALKLILEPIFEADFQPGSFGYRPRRSAHDAVQRVRQAIMRGMTRVIDLDLRSYFDNVRHHLLLEKIAKRVSDDAVLALVRMILRTSGKRGVPQGGVLSPLLSNIYLNEVDRMLERAREVTRSQWGTAVEYARFADDLVVLVDGHGRHAWLFAAVQKRIREELAYLQVEVNENKSKVVDLANEASFNFLGFEHRRVRSRKGRWMPLVMPRMQKRTELLRKLKSIFASSRSWPVQGVVAKINPILRGWVNYFAVGQSSRCFKFVRTWVEGKIRRHLARASKRSGFGWKRWSRQWLYANLRLFNGYQVRRLPEPKASPA